MTQTPAANTKSELVLHRQRLRQKRRNKLLRACWQMVLLLGAVAGLFLTFRLPFWYVQGPEQLKIRGNRLIKTEFVLDQLPLAYPVSLLQLYPAKLSAQLKAQAPFSSAIVTRQLWPATVRIEVLERPVVALTVPGPPKGDAIAESSKIGVLDAVGTWVPLNAFKKPETLSEQAPLKVLGFRTQNRPTWMTFYQAIRRSPVKISTIDFRNPQNLIISTALGTVYLGPLSAQLNDQLQILDQMRQIPTRLNPKSIDYIDLKNPKVPAVHLKKVISKQSTTPSP